MRIRTAKLKAPSPVTVLLICLIWPLAAVVGAAVCDTEHTTTPSSGEQSINVVAQKPPMNSNVASDEKKSDEKKSREMRIQKRFNSPDNRISQAPIKSRAQAHADK